MKKKLYRGKGTKARELSSFEARYGARGKYVYGATVGKIYREKYGHSYKGGSYPKGRKGHEVPERRHHHRNW